MGEIIEGKFGSRTKENTPSRKEEKELTKGEAALMAPRLVEVKLFVHSLLNTDVEATTRVATQRAVVCEYTDSELMNWLKDTREGDWRNKPYFFSALCDEFKMRCDALMNQERGT